MRYIFSIALLALSAALLRAYGPTRIGLTLTLHGVSRAVPLGIVLSWLLISLAIALAIAYALRLSRVS
jgi:hypothetical protein